MLIPPNKEKFIQDVRKTIPELNSKSFIPPSTIEIGVRNFLTSRLGIRNPNLPSVYGYHGDYSKYIEDIWDSNNSYIVPLHLPIGSNPADRATLMGHSITQTPQMSNWLESLENSGKWNNGWFSKLPYHERKYLMPVRGFEDYEKDAPDIQRFRISHIPADVKFEGCIPTINELYIAHPYRPGVYLPISRYEHLLFKERIHEMSKVMMALGATEIRTIQNDESRVYSKKEASSRISGSAGVGRWGSGSASYATGAEHSKNVERESEIVINFKNDPLKLPYLPNDLVWFNHDNDWQQIADARLNGNILEYELSLSSKQVNLVSDSERSNIEAQARILLASGSFSRETSSSSIFKEESAKSTRILIKFKSRKDY